MKIKKKNLQIAIDGPSGTGKSTLALMLAKKLGINYLYTGALYRAVTYLVLENNVALDDEKKILRLIEKRKIRLEKSDRPDRHTAVFLNGEDITPFLFKRKISRLVPELAKLKEVRKFIVALIREMAENKSVVADGRDIGTVVLPNADLKIYLTADVEERAKRRVEQLKHIGKPQSFKKVLQEISKRDKLDKNRKESPLKPASDAWVLDTTHLALEKELELILKKLKEKNLIE